MGLSQGGLAAAVAEFAPAQATATAFGLVHFVTGACQLASGALGGGLWVQYESSAASASGACWAAIALLALMMFSRFAGRARVSGPIP